jgi:serine/threonine protein kinase
MRGTSDVFSLGMTILQMIVLRSLETLNMRGNNARLMNIINTEVREEWIKSLLFAMLQEDYKRRPRFNDCLSYIQSGDTKSLAPT